MILTFTDILPNEFLRKPVLISGLSSVELPKQTFLVLYDNDILTNIYEIRYQVHCSPFKEAVIVDDLLAVGFEERFYLFNLKANENVLSLEMNGYFGHLYFNADFLYVADASGLYCISKSGALYWENSMLGLDGVVVNEITDTKISGSGEWDPPGGWKDFFLDKRTGLIIV